MNQAWGTWQEKKIETSSAARGRLVVGATIQSARLLLVSSLLPYTLIKTFCSTFFATKGTATGNSNDLNINIHKKKQWSASYQTCQKEIMN